MNPWIGIIGMAILTYGIRASFLVFGRHLVFPGWLERALHYVPAAVLSALIVPAALAPAGTIDLSAGNAWLPGALASAAVALWSGRMLAAILAGFLVYGGWRYVLSLH